MNDTTEVGKQIEFLARALKAPPDPRSSDPSWRPGPRRGLDP